MSDTAFYDLIQNTTVIQELHSKIRNDRSDGVYTADEERFATVQEKIRKNKKV